MKVLPTISFLFVTAAAQAQIHLELKFPRLQYIAHEPVVATVKITNLAGRPIDLRDEKGQQWFGFEVNAREGRPVIPLHAKAPEPALHVETGQTVTRKIDLTPLFPVHDLGAYHVRANVYFADINQFFSSPTKVFQVSDARPIWQKTVGIPEAMPMGGEIRTYSILSYRFADHAALYVRVEDKNRGVVCATYSLGRILSYEEPQAQIDHANHLHVLRCATPRKWAYSHIGLNGEVLAQSIFMETRTRPRLRFTPSGAVAVKGGMLEPRFVETIQSPSPKLFANPISPPVED